MKYKDHFGVVGTKAELEVLYDSSDEAELGIESTSELTHVYGQPVKMFFLPHIKSIFYRISNGNYFLGHYCLHNTVCAQKAVDSDDLGCL